jgi:hypothetical protein
MTSVVCAITLICFAELSDGEAERLSDEKRTKNG